MKDTKIRWSDSTLNAGIGCSRVSPGCDHCYAETLVHKRAGLKGWPATFEDAIFKPDKLKDIKKWARQGPRRIFVNSLSDLFYERFTAEQTDMVLDAMAEEPSHDYLVLTKRPQRMVRHLVGAQAGRGEAPWDTSVVFDDGWLARRGLTTVPEAIWFGVSIESDRYTWRADWLRRLPVLVRFLSCEPLLGPLPSLDLTGLSWVIEGGESGPGYREMDWDWARDLRDACLEAEVAFYHKQGSGYRTEMYQELDGERFEQYPLVPPWLHQGHRTLGVYVDPASPGSAQETLVGFPK